MTPYEILPQLLDGATITYDNRTDKRFKLVYDKVVASDGESLSIPEWMGCDSLDWSLFEVPKALTYADLKLGDRFKWKDMGMNGLEWLKCDRYNICTKSWREYERNYNNEKREVIKV